MPSRSARLALPLVSITRPVWAFVLYLVLVEAFEPPRGINLLSPVALEPRQQQQVPESERNQALKSADDRIGVLSANAVMLQNSTSPKSSTSTLRDTSCVGRHNQDPSSKGGGGRNSILPFTKRYTSTAVSVLVRPM